MLQKMVMTNIMYWMENGSWTDPDLRTAIEFMTTEAAEALDMIIRITYKDFWRTDKGKSRTFDEMASELRREIAQTIIMGIVALHLMSDNVEHAVQYTLWDMAHERGLQYRAP